MSDTNNEIHQTSPLKQSQDEAEDKIRPRCLKDFQGQEQLKENLSVFIEAARQRTESLDHVFLSGPPGLGKTTLAGIIAQEMGAEIRYTSAPALDKAKDLAGILTAMNPGSVFFIDEIHRLKPALEEMLYIAMEDFEMDWVIGQGPSARSVRIPLPPFTMIGATTKAGMVSSPLIARFGIHVRLDLYNPEELKKILERSADIMGISVAPEALQTLARSSRGTPRVANRLLRRMRDFAQVAGKKEITAPIVDQGLERLGIDEIGLEELDRRLLQILIQHYEGGPVGVETLAISIGESVDTLEDVHEPYLIQQGLLKRTPRGRVAASKAYQHLGLSFTNAAMKGNSDENQGLLF